jgi:hypothetical protein
MENIDVSKLEIKTEDGVILHPGDRAYDYYSMAPGRLPTKAIDYTYTPDLWFDFIHDSGKHVLLNGPRICSVEFAKRRGFKDAG